MKPSLTLCIKDFGNIKEAEIDIAPMMLFIGHNNTGKSYVAMLWWAILKEVYDFYPSDNSEHYQFIKQWLLKQQPNVEAVLDVILLEHCLAIFNEHLEQSKDYILVNLFNSSNISIEKISIKKDLYNFTELKFKWIKDNDKDMSYRETIGNGLSTIGFDSLNENEGIYFHATKIEDIKEYLHEIIKYIIRVMFNKHNLDISSLYLPAARSGYMQTYKMIAAEALNTALSLRKKKEELLPAPAISFLQELLQAKFSPLMGVLIAKLSNELEEKILEGIIVQKDQLGFREFVFQPKNTNKELPFHLTSTLVSELAPLIILIKSDYISSLIIEEPEAHLHPQAQRNLVKILAKLFNGFSYRKMPMLLTTHSTTIFQQVNNLITLFNHPKQAEMLEKFGYSKEELLNPDDVIAYQFEETPEGTKVSKLEKTETGFIAPTFSKGLYEFAKETRFVQEELDQDVD